MKIPSVLFVVGAYYPEISAAGLQCQAVARVLRGRLRTSVLVTAVDPSLAASDVVEDVPVTRVGVDVRSGASKTTALVRLIGKLAALLPHVDVIHLHGISQKNVPVALLGRAYRKPIVLTLHTSGQDEPQTVDGRGRLARWAFDASSLILPVSPNLVRRCEEAGVRPDRVRLTPNGIDTSRFRPADAHERIALRRELGWPVDRPTVLFVGFFSRDKRPDQLFCAWQHATAARTSARLVYVGATRSPYYEVDQSLASAIRDGAAAIGRADDVVFVEPTHDIEWYYRAADVFVLPSVREAHPVALLEAMACGLPCIASRISGSTDVVIEDGANGRLIPVDDEDALSAALVDVLGDSENASRMGQRARASVQANYDVRDTAERWLTAYCDVLGG